MSHPYVELARLSIKKLLSHCGLPASGLEVSSEPNLWNIQKACFVSIKTKAGDLRGCIGTIMPARNSIDLEIITNAVSASTKDPRFPPMIIEELDQVDISVDVLGTPEKISNYDKLDPKKWGIIITKAWQRGVLLPDLDGVDTVEQQISIAARKARIADLDGITIERFSIQRYR